MALAMRYWPGRVLEGEGGFGEEAAGVEEVVEGWELGLGGGVRGGGEAGQEIDRPGWEGVGTSAALMIIAVSSPGQAGRLIHHLQSPNCSER